MATRHERGDLERLLLEEAWLRQLAEALAAGEADEVVQRTWLRALQVDTRRVRRPRRWLARLARNVTRSMHRGEELRRLREAGSAVAEPVPSSAELAEREERRRQLIAAVDALATPHREVVLRRYFQGKAPQEIAGALGVPVHTVWNRLRAALVELRAALDRRTGDRRAWLLPLLAGAPVVRGRGRLALSAGVALVGAKLLVCAAVLVALAGLALWGFVAEGPPTSAASIEADPGGPARSAPVAPESQGGAPDPLRTVVLESESPEAVRAPLTIQVVDDRGVPQAGVPVAIRVEDRGKLSFLWEGNTEGDAGSVQCPVADLMALPDTARAFAVVRVPTREPPTLVDLPPSPAGRSLRLTLPEHGAVRVRIAGRSRDRSEVELWLLEHSIMSRLGVEENPRMRRSTERDEVLFAQVGLGLEFDLSALEVGGGARGRHPFRGPRRAGEEVLVELTMQGSEPASIPDPKSDPVPVAAGVVQDPDGRPVSGARIVLRPRASESERVVQPLQVLRDQYGLSSESDAGGAFSISGTVTGESVGVHVEAAGYLAIRDEPHPVGAEGLVLTLHPAASLEGSLAVPVGMHVPSYFRVKAVHEDGKSAGFLRLRDDGSFRGETLRPGAVTLEIQPRLEPRAQTIRVPVQLVGGETARDPALQGIPVGADLIPFELLVRSASGRAVEWARVFSLGDAGPEDRLSGHLLPLGHGEIFVREPELDLLVWAAGHLPLEAEAVQDGQELLLEPAPRVALRVGLPEFCAGRDLEVRLELKSAPTTPPFRGYELTRLGGGGAYFGDPPWAMLIDRLLDPTGQTSLFPIHQPGTWKVSLRSVGAGKDSWLDLGTITVPASPLQQSHRVELDPSQVDALQRALLR